MSCNRLFIGSLCPTLSHLLFEVHYTSCESDKQLFEIAYLDRRGSERGRIEAIRVSPQLEILSGHHSMTTSTSNRTDIDPSSCCSRPRRTRKSPTKCHCVHIHCVLTLLTHRPRRCTVSKSTRARKARKRWVGLDAPIWLRKLLSPERGVLPSRHQAR